MAPFIPGAAGRLKMPPPPPSLPSALCRAEGKEMSRKLSQKLSGEVKMAPRYSVLHSPHLHPLAPRGPSEMNSVAKGRNWGDDGRGEKEFNVAWGGVGGWRPRARLFFRRTGRSSIELLLASLSFVVEAST